VPAHVSLKRYQHKKADKNQEAKQLAGRGYKKISSNLLAKIYNNDTSNLPAKNKHR
jgi:hypothetical protein